MNYIDIDDAVITAHAAAVQRASFIASIIRHPKTQEVFPKFSQIEQQDKAEDLFLAFFLNDDGAPYFIKKSALNIELDHCTKAIGHFLEMMKDIDVSSYHHLVNRHIRQLEYKIPSERVVIPFQGSVSEPNTIHQDIDTKLEKITGKDITLQSVLHKEYDIACYTPEAVIIENIMGQTKKRVELLQEKCNNATRSLRIKSI